MTEAFKGKDFSNNTKKLLSKAKIEEFFFAPDKNSKKYTCTQ